MEAVQVADMEVIQFDKKNKKQVKATPHLGSVGPGFAGGVLRLLDVWGIHCGYCFEGVRVGLGSPTLPSFHNVPCSFHLSVHYYLR